LARNDKEDPLKAKIKILERDNRVLRKKLERSEANRIMLEEALESHIQALKVNNAELMKSQQALLESEARYRSLALYDSLTCLPSRVLFQERLERAILNAARSKVSGAVLFLDLNNFKEVNDRGGHAIGDRVLCNTASKLIGCVRQADTVARLAGDEFVIILEAITDCYEIEIIAQRILAAFSLPMVFSGVYYPVSVSIGISLFPDDGCDVSELLKKADDAMYEVKRSGILGWKFYCDYNT